MKDPLRQDSRNSWARFICFFVTSYLLFVIGTAFAGPQDFPTYPIINNNVQFWEKIYGIYSLRQAVVHDSQDLSRIYQVITLFDSDEPGAAQKNSLLQKQACEKYRYLLTQLAERPPYTPEEQRIVSLFPGKNGRLEMRAAAENVRSQTGQKERFLAGVEKSKIYLPEIKNIFRSHGLPEDLALLPHVESSFNVNAYSRVGAAGLWQFTRETGKQYMHIDAAIDERLDPIIASRAAANYLSKSYTALNNWPLAITSYNYGLGGTLRATNEEGSYERIFANYNKGYFKFAARNFYSEFLAARNVAKYLERSGSTGSTVTPKYRYLNLTSHTNIREVTRHFGLSVDTVGDFNPALRPPVLRGEKPIPKGYTLRLPTSTASPAAVVSTNDHLPQKSGAKTQYHRVQHGDTVNNIAQRHGVDVRNLLLANNLSPSEPLRLGQSIRIPDKTEDTDDAANAPKKRAQISIQKNVTTKESFARKQV